MKRLAVWGLAAFAVLAVTAQDVFLQGIDTKEIKSSQRMAVGAKAPFAIQPEAEFDPEQAGWPLVFQDDFNGTEIDWSKWYVVPWWRKGMKYVQLDGQGHLKVTVDKGDDGKLHTGRLYSRNTYRYGYIEANIKLTRNNGWWAAYWLYADSNENSFLDGFEIDIFEDYYTRRFKDANGVSEGRMTHNLHTHSGAFRRSWSFNGAYPQGFDNYFRLGCKWTPFEISFYINGKLVKAEAKHSPFGTATYDAFNHLTGITPLRIILNGEIIGGKMWAKDIADFSQAKFPESFDIDYVKVWAYPGDQAGAPQTVWQPGVTNGFVTVGEEFELAYATKTADGARITEAMLFDDGFFLKSQSAGTGKFKVTVSEAAYAGTAFVRPGRQGGKPPVEDVMHAFVVFTRDERGRVGYTTPVVKIPRPAGWLSTALQAKSGVRQLPGRVNNETIKEFLTAQWKDFVVESQFGGAFDVQLMMGSDTEFEHRVTLFVDGEERGVFTLPAAEAKHREPFYPATIKGLRLTPGRHVLTITPIGRPNLGTLSLTPVREEVLGWFEQHVYGPLPPKPERETFELREQGAAFGGYAERRQYRVVSENAGRSNVIDVLVYLPRSVKGKVPAWVFPNFFGNHAAVADEAVLLPECEVYLGRLQPRGSKAWRANVRGLIERGYAAVTFCYGSTYPDYTGGMAEDRFTRDAAPVSVWAMFPEVKGERMAHGAWAWGSMRVRDLIERLEMVDQSRVAICGHSRMGKNAIVTGVYDPRYSLVFANDGGMKRVENLERQFVHWFMPRPEEIRFEQQDFVALIAPRALFISAAESDRYQPAREAERTLDAADWVWRRGGKWIGWHSRPGQHAITEADWTAALDYAEKTLGWKVKQGPYPLIDAGPERVAESINPPFKRLGTLKPRAVNEIRSSNWTIGCECIGRGYVDFWSYAHLLRPLGIKHARIQACWARCEKEPGKFDFEWLDRIVDFARAEGIEVMLETSYGNTIYEDAGGWDLGAGFPKGKGLEAWDRWVRTLARHFRGRVTEWAMWNEPDIANPARPGEDSRKRPQEIADFNVRTARIIREEIPEAKIAGLSLARMYVKFFEECLRALGPEVKLFDSFIYHGYQHAPEESYADLERLKAVLKRYHPTAKMFQGENGCPSEWTTRFALDAHSWSEISQAKWDMRRMLGDLGHDVRSSVFTICDFNHTGREMNRKGLLRANERKEVVDIKRAYYAVQNVAAVFDDQLQRVESLGNWTNVDQEVTHYLYRDRQGRDLVVYWRALEIDYDVKADVVHYRYPRPGNSFETRPTVFQAARDTIAEPVLVDLYSGRVWEVPRKAVRRSDAGVTYVGLPLYDSPCILGDRRSFQLLETK